MEGVVCDTTEDCRLEASMVAGSDIVGILSPFRISLFCTNQGIRSALLRVRMKICSILLNRGVVRSPKKVGRGSVGSRSLLWKLQMLCHGRIGFACDSTLSKMTPRYLTDNFQAIFLPLTRSSGGSLFLLETKMGDVSRRGYHRYTDKLARQI